MIILIVALLLVSNSLSCTNNQLMKYENKNVSFLDNYPHDQCKIYTLRTCCGSANIESIRQKIQKIVNPRQQISKACKQKLSQLLCYPCDGDIGTGERQGVCPEFSRLILQACSDDYFVFQINNVLKPCDQQSITCSKLSTIVQTSPEIKTSQLFGYKQRQRNFFDKIDCFDGTSSSIKKGVAKEKVRFINRNAKSNKREKQQQSEDNTWYQVMRNLFISVGILMGATIVIMKFLRKNERDEEEDD